MSAEERIEIGGGQYIVQGKLCRFVRVRSSGDVHTLQSYLVEEARHCQPCSLRDHGAVQAARELLGVPMNWLLSVAGSCAKVRLKSVEVL
jgi:hypothetical protein